MIKFGSVIAGSVARTTDSILLYAVEFWSLS